MLLIMETMGTEILSVDLANRIRVIRNRRVLLDGDLAALYGVATFRLNAAVKRNAPRFPEDFAFRLNVLETRALTSQIAISNKGRGGRRTAPLVFTEYGALMVASILNNPRAVQMSLYVVRAFVRLREMAASSPDLATKLADLESALGSLDRETRRRFEEVYRAIRALTAPPASASRKIGFTVPST